MENKTTQKPLVTIMIPTYNQEKYIGEAIESALAQDYPNLEIIVADDCSTDSTAKKVHPYTEDHRFHYHRNKSNLGRVGNYHNTAHNLAHGEWLINLDGDDYFTSTSFITDAIDAISKATEEKGRDVVAFGYRHDITGLPEEIPAISIGPTTRIIPGKEYFLKYYRIGKFGHANFIYRRDIGQKIGMYVCPHQASDFHSLVRIFLFGDIILDSRSVSHWRVHGQNTTFLEAEDKLRQMRETLDSLQKFAEPYFSADELQQWRKGMNRDAYNDYLQLRIVYKRGIKTGWLLLTHPRPTREYLRSWWRLIFNR